MGLEARRYAIGLYLVGVSFLFSHSLSLVSPFPVKEAPLRMEQRIIGVAFGEERERKELWGTAERGRGRGRPAAQAAAGGGGGLSLLPPPPPPPHSLIGLLSPRLSSYPPPPSPSLFLSVWPRVLPMALRKLIGSPHTPFRIVFKYFDSPFSADLFSSLRRRIPLPGWRHR